MSPDRCCVPPNVDLTDPELFVSGRHHATLARLRREGPVAWHAAESGAFWAVTRHADVARACADAENFSRDEGLRVEAPDEGALALDRPLPARHRAALQTYLEPQAIQALLPGVRARVVERLILHAGGGEVDFALLVGGLPGEVMATLLGVPGAHQDRVLDWLAAATGGDAARDARREASAALQGYAEELVASKRERPGRDIASDLIRAESAGAPVTGGELCGLLLALVAAGSETLRSVACQGQRLLFENPEVAQRLRAEPALVVSAVEEMLRLAPPLHYCRRTARRDAELGGQRIAKGDVVTLWLASANRDEAVFDAPGSLCPQRAPNPHLAFAEGAHPCPGARLARLQLQVLFEELVTRFPDLEPTGPAIPVRSSHSNGIAHMPVQLGAAS